MILFFIIKGVSSSVAHKKGGFSGFFLNMKTARETNDLLRIFDNNKKFFECQNK